MRLHANSKWPFRVAHSYEFRSNGPIESGPATDQVNKVGPSDHPTIGSDPIRSDASAARKRVGPPPSIFGERAAFISVYYVAGCRPDKSERDKSRERQVRSDWISQMSISGRFSSVLSSRVISASSESLAAARVARGRRARRYT